MLYTPNNSSLAHITSNIGTTSAEYGTSVAAPGSTHTKNTTYTELIASTSYAAYGITVLLSNVGTTASTNARALVDIAIGAASSEVVIIPNLICGNAPALGAAQSGAAVYYFPIYINAGVRLSATAQASTVSDTVNVTVYLHHFSPGPGSFVGSRVTAYGANTGTSSGVSHTSGSTNAYATATQIVASTTNPIKALQLGMDLGTDTTGITLRGLVRLGFGATPDYFVSNLIWTESTTLENVFFWTANMVLSKMRFNIPAASDLRLSAMCSGTGEARGWIIYGVD
jgi:hypothetical protein